MDFWGELASGAVSPGVNTATFLAVNVVLLAALLSLIVLLAASLASNSALVPHVLVLIFLAVGLWGGMVWLFGVVGVQQQQPQQQQREEVKQDTAVAAAGSKKAA
jgi:hypothetical protein